MRLLAIALALSFAAVASAGDPGAQPGEVTLTLALSGRGQVSISPPGRVCASACSQVLPAGTAVTLAAEAGSGFVLARWTDACAGASGDSCELTLGADTTAGVVFAAAGPPPPPPATTTDETGTETTPPDGTTSPPPTATEPPPTPTTVPPGTTGPVSTEPTPGSTPLQRELDRVLDSLPIGRIAFNTPSALELEEPAVIHLVLSLREPHAQLERRITEIGETEHAQLSVSDEMEARLTGPGFRIEALRPERQPVSARDTTEWYWQIEPTRTGVQDLHLTISAFVRVGGEERRRPLETFNRTLEVRVTWVDEARGFVKGNWQWLWTAVLVPAAAWLLARRRGHPRPSH